MVFTDYIDEIKVLLKCFYEKNQFEEETKLESIINL